MEKDRLVKLANGSGEYNIPITYKDQEINVNKDSYDEAGNRYLEEYPKGHMGRQMLGLGISGLGSVGMLGGLGEILDKNYALGGALLAGGAGAKMYGVHKAFFDPKNAPTTIQVQPGKIASFLKEAFVVDAATAEKERNKGDVALISALGGYITARNIDNPEIAIPLGAASLGAGAYGVYKNMKYYK